MFRSIGYCLIGLLIMSFVGCGSGGGGDSAAPVTPPITPPVTKPNGSWTIDNVYFIPASVSVGTEVKLGNQYCTYVKTSGTMPSSIKVTVAVNGTVPPNGTLNLVPSQVLDIHGDPVAGTYNIHINDLSLGVQGTAGTFTVKVTVDVDGVTNNTGDVFATGTFTVTPSPAPMTANG